MDTIYKLSAKITPVNLKKDCTIDYGGASYAMYTRDGYGLLHLTKKIAKGCGISDSLNKLIDDFIREFEKPGDKDLLYVLNKTLAEKVNKPISDVTDKNFETSTAPNDTFNTRGFRPILILMVYCASGQRSMPVAGKPAYYLYSKDEYGILRLIERRFSRGCSVTEYDNERVDAFLNVFEQYEKNGAAITKALEAGAVVIKSADKDFLPKVTLASDNILACTIWIDNAGLVHCKTTDSLFSSDIFFHPPATTVIKNGITRTVSPEQIKKHFTPKKISANEYVMDISEEKYKQMVKITVIVEDSYGKNAIVYLFNKGMVMGR